MLTVVFNTEPGPNFISKDKLPTGSTHDMQMFHTSMRKAENYTLKVDGVIRLVASPVDA